MDIGRNDQKKNEYEELADAIAVVEQFIQRHLWDLNPKIVTGWTKVCGYIVELADRHAEG